MLVSAIYLVALVLAVDITHGFGDADAIRCCYAKVSHHVSAQAGIPRQIGLASLPVVGRVLVKKDRERRAGEHYRGEVSFKAGQGQSIARHHRDVDVVAFEQAVAVSEAVVAVGVHHAGLDANTGHGDGKVKHKTTAIAQAVVAVDDIAVKPQLAQCDSCAHTQAHLACRGQRYRQQEDDVQYILVDSHYHFLFQPPKLHIIFQTTTSFNPFSYFASCLVGVAGRDVGTEKEKSRAVMVRDPSLCGQ